MNPISRFEQPIAILKPKSRKLRRASTGLRQYRYRSQRSAKETENAYSRNFQGLDAVADSQMARHPLRPYRWIISQIAMNSTNLGDRCVLGRCRHCRWTSTHNGTRLHGNRQQKGRDTKEKNQRNSVLPRPEGYRKALRLIKWRNDSNCR